MRNIVMRKMGSAKRLSTARDRDAGRGAAEGATCRSRTRRACRGFAQHLQNLGTMRVARQREPHCQLSHYDKCRFHFISLNEMHLIFPFCL